MASSPAETDPRPLVLLVEDEVLVRATVARMLESGGFRVVSAASADEALEALGAGLGIKAVVTDVELSPGGMNGFELARTVHREYSISAVVMSGGVSPQADDLPVVRDRVGPRSRGSALRETTYEICSLCPGGARSRARVRHSAGAGHP